MAGTNEQSAATRAWRIVQEQHGVITRRQLLGLGFTRHAIAHRIASRRLHCLFRGVYAVGRPEVGDHGRWLSAVLACGEGALLSHLSAARLWGLVPRDDRVTHISVATTIRRRPGIVVHRRSNLTPRDIRRRHRIPVTAPATTIVDMALCVADPRLERTINEADQLGVIRFDLLLRELERMPPRPGLGRVKGLALRHSFRITRSELERLFLPIARGAGLPAPETLAIVEGFEVDFWFPELGLVVEADSLTYHRTPTKQLQDRLRDQAHFAADLRPLRFTHWQIAKQQRYVQGRLAQVADQRRRQVAAA